MQAKEGYLLGKIRMSDVTIYIIFKGLNFDSQNLTLKQRHNRIEGDARI